MGVSAGFFLIYVWTGAVKTNVAIDAVAIPNLGVEVGLSKKLTVDIPFYYNPWKYSDNKMLKLVMVQPELRYWLCDKFNGHFSVSI